MLEIKFDVAALYHFLHSQGLSGREDDSELSYGVHAWLGAAFGELAPQPWRLLMDKRRPPRILGYASHDAGTFQQRLAEFAEPGTFQVCPEPESMIAGRTMPTWAKGCYLGFQTLACPIGRKAGSGIEKDLFLIHADAEENSEGLCRETIYGNWAKERFSRHSVTVNSIRLKGFRLAKQKRRGRSKKGKRVFRRIVCPQALLEGELTIGDPADFTRLLSRGMGRHRAFGYGMILLRPVP